MRTAKELGKIARNTGINAPTLDRALASRMQNVTLDERKEIYVEWWAGWYEALDESLSLNSEYFTKHSTAA